MDRNSSVILMNSLQCQLIGDNLSPPEVPGQYNSLRFKEPVCQQHARIMRIAPLVRLVERGEGLTRRLEALGSDGYYYYFYAVWTTGVRGQDQAEVRAFTGYGVTSIRMEVV